MSTVSSEWVVRMQHVCKEFRLEQERWNARGLIPGRRGELRGSSVFRALDDVSLEVRRGESVGIVGGNGAGKSTVLKLLAGILEPSSGSVDSRGRLSSVIELGVGFDPELTGRENITFAAEMQGLSRKEIRRNVDWIIDFSGIEEFLEMPVKRYSTGMAARLGFSVATAVPPDLLIVDEVLSVGDYDFQRKSLERIRDLHRNGTSLVMVSHNLFMMGTLCDRMVLLERGRLTLAGAPSDVIARYIGPRRTPDRGSRLDAADEALRAELEVVQAAEAGGPPSVDDTDRADTDRADTDRADTDRADTDRADTDRADTDRADTDRADTDRADTDRADTDRADTDRADTDRADLRAEAESTAPIGADSTEVHSDDVAIPFVEYSVPDQLVGSVTIDSIEVTPSVIVPNDPVTVRATITVHRATEGVLAMSLFTSDQAVYAERELGPSEFLARPGTWQVEAALDLVPLSAGRFQFRFVVLPQDDRHFGQEFPTALAVATAELLVDGDLTMRPGFKVPTTWTAVQLDRSGGPSHG